MKVQTTLNLKNRLHSIDLRCSHCSFWTVQALRPRLWTVLAPRKCGFPDAFWSKMPGQNCLVNLFAEFGEKILSEAKRILSYQKFWFSKRSFKLRNFQLEARHWMESIRESFAAGSSRFEKAPKTPLSLNLKISKPFVCSLTGRPSTCSVISNFNIFQSFNLSIVQSFLSWPAHATVRIEWPLERNLLKWPKAPAPGRYPASATWRELTKRMLPIECYQASAIELYPLTSTQWPESLNQKLLHIFN